MPTYKIKINYETEIEALDEQEAIKDFWQNTIYDTQTDEATFINDNLTIKEIN